MPCVEHLRPQTHIITMVSNPVRYRSRYRLYRAFARRMARQHGVHFHTCEIQSGERAFAVTEAHNPNHLQLRTEDELWHKENALNLTVNNMSRHFPDWKYVLWLDADIKFHNHNWLTETLQHLQTSHVVQLFSQAIDLGPLGEALATHQGFMASYWSGAPYKEGYSNWHPGFAWGCTRRAWEGVGGLIDRAILGSADRHMAMSLVGKGDESYNRGVHPHYKHMVSAWQGRAEQYIKRDVGFVPGLITHYWHGQKRNRRYAERWKVLVENEYDPYIDVYPDHQGVLRLEDCRTKLRDDIKHYFRARGEDSIDLE